MVFKPEKCEEIAKHMAATLKSVFDLSEEEELGIYLALRNRPSGAVDIQIDKAAKELKCALLRPDKTCGGQYELPRSRPVVFLTCKFFL